MAERSWSGPPPSFCTLALNAAPVQHRRTAPLAQKPALACGRLRRAQTFLRASYHLESRRPGRK